MGDAGPLGDSAVDIPAAPVFAQFAGRTVMAGYCQLPDAIRRTVLTLPSPFGAELAQTDAPTGDAEAIEEDPAAAFAASVGLTTDQLQTLAWILRYGSSIDLGPCETLQPKVDAAVTYSSELARTGVRMLVDLQAAYRPETPSAPGPGTVELARVASQIAARSADYNATADFGTYALTRSVWHDYACPGQYIMGQVVNQAGAPVAGVELLARDEWGNVSRAVSKNGANDYGWFDFMITSTTPHDIFVTVLDPTGNPASPTITVQHGRGPSGDAPCHYLIFQGSRG